MFKYYDRWEEASTLLERSEQQNKDAEVIIDSLVVDGMRLKDKNQLLKTMLDSCQASKVGSQRIKSF